MSRTCQNQTQISAVQLDDGQDSTNWIEFKRFLTSLKQSQKEDMANLRQEIRANFHQIRSEIKSIARVGLDIKPFRSDFLANQQISPSRSSDLLYDLNYRHTGNRSLSLSTKPTTRFRLRFPEPPRDRIFEQGKQTSFEIANESRTTKRNQARNTTKVQDSSPNPECRNSLCDFYFISTIIFIIVPYRN